MRQRLEMALWGLLALASTVTTVLAEDPGGVRTLNLRFGYGFFVSDATNQTLMPEGEPTDAQISAVMCQTQYWLSKVFQDLNDAPFLTVKATNIDWMRGPIDATGTDLFEITFAAELNSLDGSPIPPEEEIIATIENPSVQVNRTQEYILNYVYSADPRDDSPNWFANVDAISFNGEFGTPTGTGRLGEADCEETLAPTPTNVTDVTDDNGNNTAVPTVAPVDDDDGDGNTTAVPTVASDDSNTTAPTVASVEDTPTAAPSIIYGPAGENVTQNGTLPPEWGGTLPPKWGNTLPPNGTFPPTPTPQTLSPTDPEFAPNTEDMVYAQIAFGFFEEGTEGTEVAEPSEDDITDLMCITMEFFRDVIRNATNDTSVQTQAMYVDWTYTEEDTESIQVSFATNATYFGTTDSVPPQTVFQALQLTEEEIVFYLENYVVGRLGTNANSSNVFADVLNSNWTTFVNKQVPVGQIEMVDCGDTKAPTAVPTVSAAPSDSSAPSMMPSVSSAPSTSSAPSLAPSVSPAPTTWAENPNYVSLVPTTWADNPNNPANGGTGTRPPTEDTGPEEPVQRPVQRLPIQVAFTVSNLNNIIEADQVNNSGLTESWPIFVEETVELISAQGNRRLLRAGHRRLSVALEPGSPRIQSIERVPCPADTHPDLTCHDTLGVYTLQLVNETNSTAVEELYGRQTANYVRSDYNDTLHREFPDTALYIGTLPPLPAGDDDDGFPIWAIILIILLVILCCLCCLLALFFLYLKDRNEEKELEPYDEEGFAYDFLIPKNEKPQTEVDDDAATKDVDEEFFEDEEAESKGIDDDNVVTVMPEDVEDHFEDEPLAEIQEGAFESDKSGEEWQDGDDEPQEEVMALEAPREATAEELESVSEEGEESTKEVSETGEELTPVSNELEESWKDEHSEKESEAEAEPDPADEETTQGGETETDAEETAEQWKDEADDESKAEDEQEASEKEASETAEEEGAEEVAEEWDVDKASEEEAFEEGDKEENEADDDWDEDSDDKEEDSDEEGWDDESK